MKKAIFRTAICAISGAILAVVAILLLALCEALPTILEWISGYIGSLATYSLFFLGLGALLMGCIKSK